MSQQTSTSATATATTLLGLSGPSLEIITSANTNGKVKLPKSYYDPKHKGWGFLYWGTLHTVADSFPESPSADDCLFITQFFHLTLPRLLPCPNCTVHLVESIKPGGSVGPVNCVSGTELTKWVNKLENSVRRREGKEELTDQDYQREYDLIRSVKWSAVLKDLKQNWSTVCNTANGSVGDIAGSGVGVDDYDKQNACSHIVIPQDFRRISNVFSSPANAVADARNSAEKNVLIMFVVCILGLALLAALVTCVTLFLKQNKLDKSDKFDKCSNLDKRNEKSNSFSPSSSSNIGSYCGAEDVRTTSIKPRY